MSIELVVSSIAAGCTVIGLIFGGGLLNRHIKQSNDLAVTRYILTETQKKLEDVILDVKQLKNSSVEVETKMEQFSEHIKKLDMIPRIDERLQSMKELVTNVQALVASLTQERAIHGS